MTPRPEEGEDRVLVLAPTGHDARLTARVLAEAAIGSLICDDARAVAVALASGEVGAVLFAEEALTDDALVIVLRALADQPTWSDVPVVLVASEDATASSNRRTFEIVDRLGHVTLLDRPVRLISLLSSLRMAIRARRRQYQARELLVRLQEGVEQRDRFLAMLGHELRNPLTAVTYAANGLEREQPNKYTGVIARQSSHLTRIVDDLLDVARVTSNKITLHRATVDLRHVVNGCVETVRLANPDFVVQADVGDVQVPVDADAVRIEQAVTNLLVNAVKYTPRGGTVRASLRTEGSEALLCVEDNGVGIAAEMLPRIFDLFTQVEGSLDRARGGLGIGLTVVRAIVELHGGSVRATSAGLGGGTCFEIRVPVASGARLVPTPAPLPATEQGDRGRGRHVLVVEDDPDIRETLQELLEGGGHLVASAADGAAALNGRS